MWTHNALWSTWEASLGEDKSGDKVRIVNTKEARRVQTLRHGQPCDCLCTFLSRHIIAGLPEVMGYLNGVLLPRIFNIKTLIVKMLSAVCAVASGLPVGPEGPLIHVAASLGAGVSQGRSRTLGYGAACPVPASAVASCHGLVQGCVYPCPACLGAPPGLGQR